MEAVMEDPLFYAGALARPTRSSPRKTFSAVFCAGDTAMATPPSPQANASPAGGSESKSPPFLKRTLRRLDMNAAEGGRQPPGTCTSSMRVLKHLNDLFPGRKHEIAELLSVLGEADDTIPPLLLYGAHATGKTSIVCESMRVLGRPHAYVSCRSCHSPRLLFESVLNQLVCHVRSAANNYSSSRRCERLPDFVEHLPGAVAQAMARRSHDRKQQFGASKKSAPVSPPCGTQSQIHPVMVYLVVDNVELMREWTGGVILLAALFKLSELARLPNLGLLFISHVGPDGFQASMGSREPLPLYFRDYNDNELFQILLQQRPNVYLYASFLSAVLKTFSRPCRRVTELVRSLDPLFQKYCEPVLCGDVSATSDVQGKRQRYTLLQPHIQPALAQTLSIGDSSPGVSPASIKGSDERMRTRHKTKKRAPKRTLFGGKETHDLEFEIPSCSKYLLLAAYIASRNAATLDACLFDSGENARGGGRRKRKSAASAMERKEAEAQERQLKGPGSFALERLLAIFRCIVVESETARTVDLPVLPQSFSLDLHQEEREGEGEVTEELTADVLMQLSTLVSVNLLYRSSTNPLEGSARYRCNVDSELIQKVAQSVNFPLSKYLLHG